MLTKVKNFTLFDDSVNGAAVEAQRKALPREAAVDRCHSYLYVLTVLLLAGALVGVQFITTSSVAVGRVTVNNVGYSTYLSGLPSDAVCTPAVPLVSYSAFAAFPITQMQLCSGAPTLAQQCAASPTCNNYKPSYPAPLGAIGKASSAILTALCSSAATGTASALSDTLLKTAFTPTVASAGTLLSLLSADSAALLSKVRGQTAAVLEGRRLFDSIERPITSVGLSMSSNHFAYVPDAISGAVPPDQDFFVSEAAILSDAFYTDRSFGSCQWQERRSVTVAVPYTYSAVNNDPSAIVRLAMQPGCVPWWKSPPDSSGNALIMARSTTCTASTSAACTANSECEWFADAALAFRFTGGYCESKVCSDIPRTSCTRNPRCQLSARGVCEGKPLMCSTFKSRASCHTSILCGWNTGAGKCAWATWTDFSASAGVGGSKIFQAAAALISIMGSSSPSPPQALDAVRPSLTSVPSHGLLNDPVFIVGGGIPFLQAREDGLFARSSILQAKFDRDGSPGATVNGNTGPCDCFRDFACIVPDTFSLGSLTISYNKSCTLYNTIMSLPLTTFSREAMGTMPGLSVDLFGSIPPSVLSSNYGIDTLEDAFRQAFILTAAPTVNHQAYYAAIGPVSCTYSANLATTPLQAITTILGIIGGLLGIIAKCSGFVAGLLISKGAEKKLTDASLAAA